MGDNALLITASPHLAADWKSRMVKESQQEVCETPRVLFWQEWLNQLAGTLSTSPIPLTRLQEERLWERAISNDLKTLGIKVASTRALIRGASEAWGLIQEYRVPLSEIACGGEEGEAVVRWIEAVQQELKKQPSELRMLTSEMPSLISDALSDRLLEGEFPQQILIDGFESLTPIQLEIFEKIDLAGCNVSRFEEAETGSIQTLTTAPDATAEQAHIVARIKSLLDQNPQMRIGIAISEFCDNSSLQRLLDSTLVPESSINPAYEFQAVNMAGRKLSDTSMVQQLLHLLSIAGKTTLPFSDFLPLLFSPWVKGFEDERSARANLDATFRRQNRHHLSLNSLKKSSDLEHLPHFQSVIRAMVEWNRESRPAAAWIKAIQKLLQASGFIQAGVPNETLRSNIEIRQMNMFRDTLLSLVAIDKMSGSISWREFLSLLRSICSEKRFALTAKFPNIMVIPLSRIAGLRFDHLFITGMDEGAFPPPAKPHPLLPLRLQQQYKIPMSSGSLCFESANWLWQQLLVAAPTIEITYAEQRDEHEQLPSSFLNSLARSELITTPPLSHKQALESFDDSLNTPLQRDERVRGGTSIIRLQSACPFRAFVTHRLGIAELGTTVPGIEASTKGSLIHLALEVIWNRLKSQRELLALSHSECLELIDSAIETALKESRSSPAFNLRKFEKKRMRRLLNEWLKLAASRPPFEVTGNEERYELNLPEKGAVQFPITIKADRMDRDGEGHRILIDYKTGAKQSPAKWLGERMEEPQLPIYAVAAELTEQDAVAFATLRSGDQMGFEGLSGADTA
ncbi:MAG: hypothetical protein GQ467_00445, partial [Mariprofundaceae bacterium]|nr:hypothetical protein [Mariprofundaceae bacterium]